MDCITDLFDQTNIMIVYFVYGLVFVMMGFAIALQHRRFSYFRLARRLWLLAVFGLLHGFSEWGVIFIPLQIEQFTPNGALVLKIIHNLLVSTSFLFLFIFGTNLLVDTEEKFYWLRYLPFIMFGIWLILFLTILSNSIELAPESWAICSEGWARYLLGFPGALITGYALLKQLLDMEAVGNRAAETSLKGAAITFFVYAVVAGLVVPKGTLFPAVTINQETLIHMLGLPIPVLRALCGGAAAFFIVRLMDIFNQERTRRLEQAERMKAVFQERERIGRDLHDGIIQSIYATGLQLENSLYLLEEGQCHKVQNELREVLKRLNLIIHDIRHYILDLKPRHLDNTGVHQMFFRVIHDFRKNSGIKTNYYVDGSPARQPDSKTISHIYHICQEVLNNIIKHAGASNVSICLCYTEEDIQIAIEDDGVGFEVPTEVETTQFQGQGLTNIKERCKIIGARMQLFSEKGKGTKVQLEIPYGVD